MPQNETNELSEKILQELKNQSDKMDGIYELLGHPQSFTDIEDKLDKIVSLLANKS